ncbi:hypothetical protein [Lacinutrix mariniflava]|uniref:hypothetical protein n=1 Tax=Lacinutrix mariniflava TaxID=342955 RepID=UPI0006E25969|nr:hypothetical protein [Lacinutrix mariniflava]
MKTIISYFIIITLLFNCKNKNEDAIINSKIPLNSQLEVKDQTKEINADTNINLCLKEKQDFKIYKELDNKINILNKIDPGFYFAITKKNFNDLFLKERIECVSSARSERYTFSEIVYNEKQNSEDIFLKIKNLKKNDENLNKYHDFFKRGLVFILDSKKNKITIISFNIFSDNSLPKTTKKFFLLNKNSFEKVFMTTGIHSVEDIFN